MLAITWAIVFLALVVDETTPWPPRHPFRVIVIRAIVQIIILTGLTLYSMAEIGNAWFAS
jgi:hypothetical protein